MQARLVSTHDLAPEVRHFEFEIAGCTEFPFTPGQFVSIKEQVAGKEVTRAYSIASPPNGNRFSLCLNRVPEGLVSPRLFAMAVGEELEVQEPLGYFTLRRPERPSVFVATGTGVAPFRSILLSSLPRQNTPITLLFGARHRARRPLPCRNGKCYGGRAALALPVCSDGDAARRFVARRSGPRAGASG